jgi:integrase
MARPLHRLSASSLKRTKRGLHADGGGLYLRISYPGPTRSWVFRYERAGRSHDMGLGSVNALGLADAREVARECRRQLALGVDPIADRRSKQQAEQPRKLFRDCLTAYIDAHEREWSNAKHRTQWRTSLERHAAPIMGRYVDSIDTAALMHVLEPIWRSRHTTATRVRGRIEQVLSWATVHGYRTGENPARWRGHLQHLLGNGNGDVTHHPALPYSEIGPFMAALRTDTSLGARALELLILTASRNGEVLGARWTEINEVERIWTIPANRMKSRRDHRVPLSSAALELLRGLPRIGVFVFPGRDSGAISPAAPRAAMERIRSDLTLHGFRSTFRTWAAERTSVPREICELALAHVIIGDTERAYERGDALEKRRQLMDMWAKYCAALQPAASNVIAIGA